MSTVIERLKAWFVAKLFAYLATKEKFDITKKIDCGTCKGAGFDPRLTNPNLGDYDRICDECAGQSTVESIYLRRWYLFKSKYFNIMLHNIRRSDDDPDPHDHPWGFVSVILRNGYVDEQYKLVTLEKDIIRSSPPFWEERAGNFFEEFDVTGDPDDKNHFRPLQVERRGSRSGPFFKKVRPGMIVYRGAHHIHRVIIKPGKPAWTLVFAGGDTRPWGFIKRIAWVYWREYLGCWKHKHV